MEIIPRDLNQEFESWRFSDVRYVSTGEAGQLMDYTLNAR